MTAGLAMVVGAAVGVALASNVIDNPQALEMGNAAAEADQACGLSAIPVVFGRLAVAACVGAIAGGVVAALALTVVSWLGNRR